MFSLFNTFVLSARSSFSSLMGRAAADSEVPEVPSSRADEEDTLFDSLILCGAAQPAPEEADSEDRFQLILFFDSDGSGGVIPLAGAPASADDEDSLVVYH